MVAHGCARKLGPLAVLLEVATTLTSLLVGLRGVVDASTEAYTCMFWVRHVHPEATGCAREGNGGACATVTERVGVQCWMWDGQNKAPTSLTVILTPLFCHLRAVLTAV
jgi:hypothetical protein